MTRWPNVMSRGRQRARPAHLGSIRVVEYDGGRITPGTSVLYGLEQGQAPRDTPG